MQIRPLSLALLLVATIAAEANAAGRVQLQLIGDAQGAALLFQQWGQALDRAGIKNVRIRSGRSTDKVGIQSLGTEASPYYIVTGMIRSSDELVLPNGRYTRRDLARLDGWLKSLAEHGPGGPSEPVKAAFGLTPQQFQAVREDAAQPIGSSTEGISRADAVRRIASRMATPVRIDPGASRALGEDTVAEELSELSAGTALACVLRPAGYCLVPRASGSSTMFTVVAARPGMEVWPVGWESDRPRRDLLPALFEFHNINIQGVSASLALTAIAKKLGVPVLIDHNALARHGIDPSKKMVSHPRSRTTYSQALNRILFQAGLKSEVRVDEAGKAFLWVSTIKPV